MPSQLDPQVRAAIITVAGEWAVQRLNRESKETTLEKQLIDAFKQSYDDILNIINLPKPSTVRYGAQTIEPGQ